MTCALRLAQSGEQNVTVLERCERLGRKLSATGNGQGNVTNVHFGAAHYFSDDLQKTESVLNGFTADELIAYLQSLGGLFEWDEKGRVYPTGRQASAITDLFRFALSAKGVTVQTGAFVEKIQRNGEGYTVFAGEKKYQADVLIVAAGGKAAKNFGTDGSAYRLVESLSHTVTALYPALVQLKTETADIKSLKGIRSDCAVTAIEKGKRGTRVRGDVIFTDYGVSGNAVFFLSSYLTDKSDTALEIDFLPDVTEERLTEVLKNKQENSPEAELLSCIVNNQLGRCIVNRVKKSGAVTAERVAAEVKKFRLKVTGTLGFDYAQVTRGGVPMSEVNEDLSSKKSKNLYLCGEILNVDGECGGYNLQWAFSSAVCVANAITGK